MNQTFKQKALAAAITAALVVGTAGVSTQAFANQFESVAAGVVSTTVDTVAAKKAALLTTTQGYKIQVATGDTIGAGNAVIGLDNGAKFLGAVVTGTGTAGGGTGAANALPIAANTTRTVTFTTVVADSSATIKIGGVTFTITTVGTASASVTSSLTGSTVLGTSATGTAANDAAAALNAALVAVFGSGASAVATNVVTLNPTAAFPLNFADTGYQTAKATAGDLAGSGWTVTTSDAATVNARFINAAGQLVVVTTGTDDGVGPAKDTGSISAVKVSLDTSASSTSTAAVNASVVSGPIGLSAGSSAKIATVGSTSIKAALATGSSATLTSTGVQATLPTFTVTETFANDLPVTSVANQAVIKVALGSSLPIGAATLTASGGSLALAGNTVTNAAGAGSTTASVVFMKADGSVGTFVYDASGTAAQDSASFTTACNTFAGAGTCTDGTGTVTIVAGKGAVISAADSTSVTGVGYGISGGVLSAAVKTASGAAAGTVQVASATVNVPATATPASVDATVTAVVGTALATSTSVVNVMSVAAGGTTFALNQSATYSAKPVIYTGRATNDPMRGSSGCATTDDFLKFSEGVAGYVPATSLFTLTSNTGKISTLGTTVGGASTGTPAAIGAFALDSTGTIASTTIGTASSGNLTDRYNCINIGNVDLSTVTTTGDFTITLGGASQIAAATATVASIQNATNASVSGALPAAASGVTVSLPTVVIAETNPSALTSTSSSMAVGFYVDPSKATISTTGAKVKAFKADGTDVSASVLGSSTGASLTAVAGVSGAYYFNATGSTTNTGAYSYQVAGLTATGVSTVGGDLTATVGGVDTAATASSTVVSSDKGGKATKATVTVGKIVSSTTPTYPTATVADQTKLTLTNLPLVAAGNDQGKPGAVYVALIFQGNVFFLGADGAWSTYTAGSNVPAYFTGAMGTTNLNIVPTAVDVSAAKGAVFVAGYGLGIAGLSNPFDDFIKNARYNVVYTVK